MSNINDKATVDLFVNGEQSEAAMDGLSKRANLLEKVIADTLAAGDKKQADKLQRELNKVNKEFNGSIRKLVYQVLCQTQEKSGQSAKIDRSIF